MTWVKLDDGFAENPKVIDLSDEAFRCYVEALCFAARNLTDGDIPERVAARFGEFVMSELIEAGLVESVSTGRRIHDYLTYNPTRTKVLAERDGARDRKEKSRRKSRGTTPVTDTYPVPGPVPVPEPAPEPEALNLARSARGDEAIRPTTDQLYLARKLDEDWGGRGSLTPAALVKLNRAHGIEAVTTALRGAKGFPPDRTGSSAYGYVQACILGELVS